MRLFIAFSQTMIYILYNLLTQYETQSYQRELCELLSLLHGE